MGDVRRVDLFVEDIAMEGFAVALLGRLAREEGVGVNIRRASARGGASRALAELYAAQVTLLAMSGAPDLLVVVIDGNCTGWHEKRAEIVKTIDDSHFPRSVVGCPDPHVECWYLADPDALRDKLGISVSRPSYKCERGRYKKVFLDALAAAGHDALFGGAEFAEEIVAGMDLYRACKNDPSLKAFQDELKNALRQWR